MRISILLLAAMLTACASQQVVTLLPRATALERGTGTLDRLNHDLTVTVGGDTYQGKAVLQTASSTTSFGIWQRTSTHNSNQSTALLLGKSGQMRCEFGWDSLMIQATGVCVDHRNHTFDILISNP